MVKTLAEMGNIVTVKMHTIGVSKSDILGLELPSKKCK